MADLCHNCGNCHLGRDPTPCQQPLVRCVICGHLGHSFNFCPAGVHQFDKGYQYLMICHNCEGWHLPQPCTLPLKQCPNCLNLGHTPHFCPVHPRGRARPLTHQPLARQVENLNKRARADSDSFDRATSSSLIEDKELLHPDLIKHLKYDGAKQAISLLQRRMSVQAILQYMLNEPVPTPAQVSPNGYMLPPLQSIVPPSIQGTIDGAQMNARAMGAPDNNVTRVLMDQRVNWQLSGPGPGRPSIAGNPQSQLQSFRPVNPMTPTPSSALEQPEVQSIVESDGVQGPAQMVHQSMQDKFQRDDFAKEASFDANVSQDDTPADGTSDKSETVEKQKVALYRRCAACKKKHAKCQHNDARNPDLQHAKEASAGDNQQASAHESHKEPTPTLIAKEIREQPQAIQNRDMPQLPSAGFNAVSMSTQDMDLNGAQQLLGMQQGWPRASASFDAFNSFSAPQGLDPNRLYAQNDASVQYSGLPGPMSAQTSLAQMLAGQANEGQISHVQAYNQYHQSNPGNLYISSANGQGYTNDGVSTQKGGQQMQQGQQEQQNAEDGDIAPAPRQQEEEEMDTPTKVASSRAKRGGLRRRKN